MNVIQTYLKVHILHDLEDMSRSEMHTATEMVGAFSILHLSLIYQNSACTQTNFKRRFQKIVRSF